MSDTLAEHPESLPLAIQREIDAVCMRFEAAWQAGQSPCTEEYLGNTTEPTRSALRTELLRLESDYRSRKGGLPRLPGYEVLHEIGRGGMGVVYKARQVKAGRLVALKCVLTGRLAGPEEIDRFAADARIAAGLDHPNIVPVYEVGEYEGLPFFTMKLVEGGSLADEIVSGPLPSDTAARIVATVARAVHYAHTKGVIHRDLKPANILLQMENGEWRMEKERSSSSSLSILHSPFSIPILTDFGLARKLDAGDGPTMTGAILGTPGYMSPEQAGGRSKEPTPAMDVYGLGAVLYALLTGRAPFQAESPWRTVLQVVEERPAPPRLLNPDIPKDLETICLKCLEKAPAHRYPTAEAVADDLERFLDGEPISARPPTWGRNLSLELGKRRDVFDPQAWSRLNYCNAATTAAANLFVFWLVRQERTALLYWLCNAVYVAISVFFYWFHLKRQKRSLTQDERDLLRIWAAYTVAALVLCLLAAPWDRENILRMYAPVMVLGGFSWQVMGRLYWGRLYLCGFTHYLAALLIQWQPEWAPLVAAFVSAGCQAAVGFVVRRLPMDHRS